MHPQVIGRPYRLEMLEEVVRTIQEPGGVRIATCPEIVERVP
jgi:hypothetical protein